MNERTQQGTRLGWALVLVAAGLQLACLPKAGKQGLFLENASGGPISVIIEQGAYGSRQITVDDKSRRLLVQERNLDPEDKPSLPPGPLSLSLIYPDGHTVHLTRAEIEARVKLDPASKNWTLTVSPPLPTAP